MKRSALYDLAVFSISVIIALFVALAIVDSQGYISSAGEPIFNALFATLTLGFVLAMNIVAYVIPEIINKNINFWRT